MSHYAKLITALACDMAEGRVTLPVGSRIKSVELEDGVYRFWADLGGGSWGSASTDADLPAFTDRGRAHRANRAHRATLRPGRPAASSEAATERLVCKVTKAQAKAVVSIAEKEATSVPGLIRRALIERGMPE